MPEPSEIEPEHQSFIESRKMFFVALVVNVTIGLRYLSWLTVVVGLLFGSLDPARAT